MSALLTILAVICIGVYALALTYINMFCLIQLRLLWSYRHKAPLATPEPPTHQWPPVTVQLPIYNEQYVIKRLLHSVADLDYPRESLEIQVLDDSTDETTSIAQALIDELCEKGLDVKLVRRPERVGYKAGALAYGMNISSGEFIAIFDADFLPQPDFLKKTIPYFESPQIGVVQTRWDHLNESYSLLTRLQAFQLNVHFTIEQTGRQASELFLQFNGTGGVWRRETIEDAGGWHHDTLTEDLDLSYRAQLRGWEIRYLEQIGTPAELPADMSGLRSQQYRWMKGGAETARKMLPHVWRSDLPLSKKIHSTFHLLSSAVFIILFIAAVLSYPVMVLVSLLEWHLSILGVFFIGLISLILVYSAGNYRMISPSVSPMMRILRIVVLFPVFLALSMGLSLHNSIATIRGFMGRQSPFVRTPKFNLVKQDDNFSRKKYFTGAVSTTAWVELGLSLYFFSALVFAWWYGNYTFTFYHGLLCLGFGSISYLTIKHAMLR